MKKLFYLLITGMLISCQDVIDLEVPDTINSIAISGRVTDSEPAYVNITRTAGYFDQGKTPRILTAKVWLLEDGDTVSILTQDSVPGLYRSDFTGSIGHSYEVHISIENDPVFRDSKWASYPETLNRVFEIDSLEIRLLNRNTLPQAFTEGYYALMYFQEPSGRGDHYRVRIWENDSLLGQDIMIFNDDNLDGAYIGKGGIFPGFTFYGPFRQNTEEYDSAGVEISSISKGYFDYLNLVNEQVFQVGSTFDPPPQTIVGNIYNIDNPKENGFGYFGASAVRTDGIRFNP